MPSDPQFDEFLKSLDPQEPADPAAAPSPQPDEPAGEEATQAEPETDAVELERAERFLVLVGGAEPKIQAEVTHALVQLKGGMHPAFADVVLTNVGMLLVRYTPVDLIGGGGQAALTLGYGVLGGAAAAIWDGHKYQSRIREYERHSNRNRALPLVDRYTRKPVPKSDGALFLPADELKPFRTGDDGTILFGIREIEVSLSLKQQKKLSIEKLEKWRTAAAQRRRALDGGPDPAGAPALIEWMDRPAGETPRWVIRAIDGLETLDEIPFPRSEQFASQAMLRLVKKLDDMPLESARTVARRLRRQLDAGYSSMELKCGLGFVACAIAAAVGWAGIEWSSGYPGPALYLLAICGSLAGLVLGVMWLYARSQVSSLRDARVRRTASR